LEIPVTKDFVDKRVRINVLQSSSKNPKSPHQLAVAVDFPPNALKPGWKVMIRRPESSVLDDSKFDQHSSDCGSTSSQKTVSPPFEIDVYDQHGNRVTKFDPPLKLSSFANIDGEVSNNRDKHKKVCFGYNNGEGSSEKWSCVDSDEFDVLQTQTDNTKFVSSTSDHLTSFAVLLGSNTNGECSGWGWIQITSLVLIGSCCCFSLLIGALYLRSKRFQAMVQGYDSGKRLTKIQTKVVKKETEIVSETSF